jgi:hypothetical protein
MQLLRNDAGFTYNRNKIRITYPARKDVHVQVMFDPRSSGAPEIKTDIESIRMIFPAQSVLAALAHYDQILQFFRVCLVQKEMWRLATMSRWPEVYGKRFSNTKTFLLRQSTKLALS